MSTFGMGTYDPTAGKTCRCGNDIGCVRGELDGEPRCTDCIERDGWPEMSRLIEALDDVDSAVYHSQDHIRVDVFADAVKAVFDIGADRVTEAACDSVIPDAAFVTELVVRATGHVPVEQVHALVRLLAPDLGDDRFRDLLEAGRNAAEISSARNEAMASDVGTGLLILDRMPNGMTLGAAVEQLGIDFERFSGAAQVAAAQRGVAVHTLPDDTVTELINASKKENG